MSGPKTSRYTLTAEQRRILALQREIERRKSIANESINRNHQRLLKMRGQFACANQVSEELQKRSGDDGGFSEKLKELEDTIAKTASVASRAVADDLTALESKAKVVADGLAQAEALFEKLNEITASNEVVLQNLLSEDIDKGFQTSFADVENTASSPIEKAKEGLYDLLVWMKNQPILSQDYVGELDGAIDRLGSIQDEAFLRNYTAVTVKPLLKRCQQFITEYNLCHEEFERLFAEYTAICNLYGYVAQEYPCTLSSVQALKAEIDRIKSVADEDNEQAYIRDCIDETMEEMGYSVIGSREVAKKNGSHFRNELYKYEDGTAINVTYSDDGRIAMELGGIDKNDRLPNDDEAVALCGSMERFCGDFKEIEKRLLAKGVVLADRVSMLPPSVEYAQIINTDDYDMSIEIESLQVKRHRRFSSIQDALRKEQ